MSPSEYDPTAVEDEPAPDDEKALEPDGDDSVHQWGDGTEDPPEPGAGLGKEVEEVDPENE